MGDCALCKERLSRSVTAHCCSPCSVHSSEFCAGQEGQQRHPRNRPDLQHKDRSIQSDCTKVLYEIGFLEPELIAAYAGDFLQLLGSRNNRLVWGSLIALSTIAALQADALYPYLPKIRAAMENGTVITVDAGVKTLAQVAAQSDAYRREILPFLLEHLRTCRPQSVEQHAEAVLAAMDAAHRDEFLKVLDKRLEDLSVAAATRVKRFMKATAPSA